MDDRKPVLGRVEKAIGPAAATMFIEEGTARHFIGAAALTVVALYVLGKYLDGFMEGLGIPELGKKHGQMVAAAVRYASEAIEAAAEPDPRTLELHAGSMSQAILALQDHRSDPRAREEGTKRVLATLDDRGIPAAEALSISRNIEGAVWNP